MPMTRSLGYVTVGALVVMTLLLAACGPSSPAVNSKNPVKGGTLIDGLFEEPDTLMSGITSETYAVMVDAAIWTPLWVGDDHGTPQPMLATTFPSTANGGISADGKTITIHLNPAKWSDGQPLTADDVVWTIQLEMNPAYGLKSALDTANIASVTAADPQTVQIVLKHVEPPFLATGLVDNGTFDPMPKHIYGSMSPAQIAQVFTPMVTSGPFMFQSESDHVKGDHITLYRNPNYFKASQGLPYLDEVIFKIIPNTNSVLTALQSGSIDTSWFLSVTNLDAYRAIQGYTQTQDTVGTTWEVLGFNETNAILNDPVIRKVIAGSIDFSSILAILKGTAKLTCDDAVGTFGHDQLLIPCYHAIDQTTAGQMLDQDGWTMGSDNVRHKGGKVLELRYTTTANNARRSETQLLVKQALAPLGIKIDIVNQEATQYFGTTLYNYSAYDIYEFASSAGFDPDDHTLFECSQFTNVPGGSNYSHYCNQAVDAQYQIELSNPDQNARKAAFTAIHTQLIQDLPVVWLYTYPDLAEYKTTVHNYKTAGTGETWNIYEWWCTNGKC